jgi:hypothetical protein
MKAAALVIMCKNGEIVTRGDTSVVSLLDVARSIRQTGEVDGKPVAEINILSNWQAPQRMTVSTVAAAPKAKKK